MKLKLTLLILALLFEVYQSRAASSDGEKAFAANRNSVGVRESVKQAFKVKNTHRPAGAGVLGITSLVLGLVGVASNPMLFLAAGLVGLIALVLGISALKHIKRGDIPRQKKPWAWVGVVTGGLSALSAVLFIALLAALFSSWGIK
jgi:hypothetical protein